MKYIGYTNEDNDAEGLGILFSSKEFYMGNFRSGSLDYCGRILYGNGQVYHGQFLDGEFNGNGMFYNPRKNQSIMIFSTPGEEYEVIEKLEGYVLIDFKVQLGTKIKN